MKPYEVVVASRDSALNPTQRLVLIAVAFRGDGDAGCFASAATLAADTALNRKTVHRVLHELTQAGWLTREDRPGFTAIYRCIAGCPRKMDTPSAQDGGSPPTLRAGRTPPPRRTDTPSAQDGHPLRAGRTDLYQDLIQDLIPDPIQRGGGGWPKVEEAFQDLPRAEVPSVSVEPVLDETHPDVQRVLAVQEQLVTKRDIAAVVAAIRKGDTANHLLALYRAAERQGWWLEDDDQGRPRLRLANVLGWGGARKRLEAEVQAARPAKPRARQYLTVEEQELQYAAMRKAAK